MHTKFTKQHTQHTSIFRGQINTFYKDNAFFPYFLIAMSILLMRPTVLNKNYFPLLPCSARCFYDKILSKESSFQNANVKEWWYINMIINGNWVRQGLFIWLVQNGASRNDLWFQVCKCTSVGGGRRCSERKDERSGANLRMVINKTDTKILDCFTLAGYFPLLVSYKILGFIVKMGRSLKGQMPDLQTWSHCPLGLCPVELFQLLWAQVCIHGGKASLKCSPIRMLDLLAQADSLNQLRM